MENEPILHGILHDQIDQVWCDMAPLIERALPYTGARYNLEDIRDGIKSRELQLWAASREGKATAVMVTKIIQFPQAKTLLIMLYAGESLKNMIHFKPIIYQWAIENGCQDISIYGRPGWERTLKDEGYEKVHTVLRMKL